jgi:hypothetical protein
MQNFNTTPNQATTAVRRRLHLAYPELAALFALLSATALRGEPWQRVVNAYIGSLGTRALDRLTIELGDLFLMGVTDDLFDPFCQGIGLTTAVADSSHLTVSQFVATLEERIRAERLERFASAT